MKRFILSIILLIVIIGVGQLLMHIAPTQNQQPSETSPESIPADSISVIMATDTITPDSLPTDTTSSIVTAN